jgi:hypothetical protein
MKATLTTNPRLHRVPLRALTVCAIAAMLVATATGGCRSSASERDRLHAELRSSQATLEARAGLAADSKAAPGAKGAKSAKGKANGEALPRPIEAGAFGSITGQIYPVDAEAVVHFYGRDDKEAAGYAFSDPSSGSFTVPELPVDIYRVVVRPENPALEPRVLEDVVVPWGGEGDLGTIDLRPGGEQIDPVTEESEEFNFEDGISADVFGGE